MLCYGLQFSYDMCSSIYFEEQRSRYAFRTRLYAKPCGKRSTGGGGWYIEIKLYVKWSFTRAQKQRKIIHVKPLVKKVVLVVYERWQFTRGSNCNQKTSTGKILMFWIGNGILERLSITITSNGKREFLLRNQVSTLLFVYCSLFQQINQQFHAIFY